MCCILRLFNVRNYRIVTFISKDPKQGRILIIFGNKCYETRNLLFSDRRKLTWFHVCNSLFMSYFAVPMPNQEFNNNLEFNLIITRHAFHQ